MRLFYCILEKCRDFFPAIELLVEQILKTGASTVISTDMGCLMHLEGYIKQKGHNLRTLHLADVLANGW